MSEAQFQITSKSNFILKHETQYGTDELFKWMVDFTVYFTATEREDSIYAVDFAYGYKSRRFHGTD